MRTLSFPQKILSFFQIRVTYNRMIHGMSTEDIPFIIYSLTLNGNYINLEMLLSCHDHPQPERIIYDRI